jgi:ribose transport system permease protein
LVGVAALLLLLGLRDESFYRAFLSFYNAKTILTQSVIVGIGALGMTLIIVSGGIDLSVGSQIALGTVVVARLLGIGGLEDPASLGLALLAALAGMGVCGLTGWLNGWVSARYRVVPFIVTLGSMQVARGLAKWLGREQTVVCPPNDLQLLMLVDPEPAFLVVAPGVWLLLLLGIALHVLLTRTVFGRHIVAIGSSEQTARLCGLRVERRRMQVYALGGLFMGLASVMQFANLSVGDPTAAIGLELDIIAAVVIGGGSLRGGEGSAAGSLAGALLIALLRNGCNLLGAPNWLQEIIIGAIIVGAVMADTLRQRRAQESE